MPLRNQSENRDAFNEYERYDSYQDDNIDANLARLPLPGPALVVDLRPADQRSSSLLWNLATEVEDLATEMRLHQVARWRYLAECIDVLRIDTIKPNDLLNEAEELVITTRTDTLYFPTIPTLMKHITEEFIDSVRNSRTGATRDFLGNDRHAMRKEPDQSTVRVFLLIDITNTRSLANAVLFSHYLKAYNYNKKDDYSYDDPHITGRDERISTIAICMNANQDPNQERLRSELLHQEQVLHTLSNVNSSRTKFDMVILIQKYRNDDTYIGEGMQAYEVDLVLYTLLLVSAEQLTEAWNKIDESDMRFYVSYEKQEEEKTPPTPIYMLGMVATEYSARWGRRWLDYGLASYVIDTLCSTAQVGSDEALLQLPDKRNWFDEWWSEANNVLPEALGELFPQMQALERIQQRTKTPFFKDTPPTIPTSTNHLHTYAEQLDSEYKSFGQPVLEKMIATSRQPQLLATLLHEESRNRQTSQPDQWPFSSLKMVLTLQEQAEKFFSSLSHGARSALPRARRQLIALNERVSEIEKITSSQPYMNTLYKEFEQAAEEAQIEVRRTLPARSFPILGIFTRISSITLIAVFSIGLLCWFGLAGLLPIIWADIAGHQPSLTASLHNAYFLTLTGLRLCLLLVLLGVVWYTQRRLTKHYEQKRKTIEARLQAVSQRHVRQVQRVLTAHIALSLLEQAGLYSSHGGLGRVGESLRKLNEALLKAKNVAEQRQQDAWEHLEAGLSERQVGLTRERNWVNLRVRRDLLKWEQVQNTFETVANQFSHGTPALDMLANHLLRQMEMHSSMRKLSLPSRRVYRSISGDEKQMQDLGSELTAAMILSQTIDYDLAYIQTQVERYQQLQEGSSSSTSSLAESITLLREEVAKARLAQISRLNRELEKSSPAEMKGSFFSRPRQSVADTLAIWTSNQYKEEAKATLITRSIAARLHDNHTTSKEALDDLRARYSLFGYHDAAQMDDDRFYLLVAPSLATDDFLDTLETTDSIQAPSFRRLHFPDGEKLIYLHVHRLRFSSSSIARNP